MHLTPIDLVLMKLWKGLSADPVRMLHVQKITQDLLNGTQKAVDEAGLTADITRGRIWELLSRRSRCDENGVRIEAKLQSVPEQCGNSTSAMPSRMPHYPLTMVV